MTWNRYTVTSIVLLAAAVLAFVIVGLNWTPKEWTVQLIPLGLACFAASFLPGHWVRP